MSHTVIKVENLFKEYKLGVINHGTLTHDLQSWWARMRGREDPNSLISMNHNVNAERDSFLALKDVSFEVKQGDRVGIIGKNGAGKSTLLKILSKITSPTKGQIKIKGRIGALLEVGTGFHQELTGRENIYLNGAILGMSRREIDRKLDEIIDFAGVEKHIDTPVKRYSSGMNVRLGFAVAAHLEPEILIVDEVLAVGDVEFQKKAIGKMEDVSREEGRTILFVSHNMAAIESLCDNTILLSNGTLNFYGQTINAVNKYFLQINSLNTSHEPKDISFCLKNKFTINDISILDDKGLAVLDLISGFSYKIKIRYTSFKYFSNVRVILKINDLSSRTYLTLSNYWDGNHFNIKEGSGVINVEIKKLPIPEGEYILQLEIRGDDLNIESIHLLSFSVILTKFFKDTKRSIQSHGMLVEHSLTLEEEIV